MLLRRLKLDWRYGLGEFLIVVAGVMMALAADGWIHDRADRALEARYLEDLATDLASDTAEINYTISLAAQRAELGHHVLQAMAGDTVLEPVYLATAVERVMYFTYPAYARSTISDLMSTGNLKLLGDRELKRRLSEYYQAIDRMEQWSGNWRRIQMDLEYHLPELLDLAHREALIAPGAPIAGSSVLFGPLPWAPELAVTAQDAEQILARLTADPEIRPRIEGMVRVQDNQYSFLRRLRVQADNTLQAVQLLRDVSTHESRMR
ncbi:MAG: hypothetical protein E4H28_01980 [Gemmatimonadales bacterium]|nr:MAG: hypothetical protein E4H28_01980 [Gemmatimonadales bacterium]